MWNSGSEVIRRSAGRQLHPVREALSGHRVRAVGLHDELGPAGRPRRRDQYGDVVGLTRRRGAADRGRRRVQSPPVATSCTPSTDVATSPPSGGSSASVITARGCVCPTSPELGRGGRRVRRHGDRAERTSASQHSRYGGVVRAVRTTRSPCRMPRAQPLRHSRDRSAARRRRSGARRRSQPVAVRVALSRLDEQAADRAVTDRSGARAGHLPGRLPAAIQRGSGAVDVASAP